MRQLPWTHHLIILSQAKPVDTREFYILAAIEERWSKRELERQIKSGAVLRDARSTKKVSPAVRQTHPGAVDEFKNAYNVEFLGLAGEHSEADLDGALLRNLGRFLTELLFHEQIPDAYVHQVFDVMRQATQHRFQVLTKRPERLRQVRAPRRRRLDRRARF